MAVIASGKVSFGTTSFEATSVRVEGSVAEVVDMTSASNSGNQAVMVPSGAYSSPGSAVIEALISSSSDPSALVGTTGNLSYMGFGRRVVCTSVSIEGRTGDLIRCVLSFTPTDYTGS
jgi:hypothetical protein